MKRKASFLVKQLFAKKVSLNYQLLSLLWSFSKKCFAPMIVRLQYPSPSKFNEQGHNNTHSLWVFFLWYVFFWVPKTLLLEISKKSSSVSARKLKCPSSARLGSEPSQLGSSWKFPARAHHYLIETLEYILHSILQSLPRQSSDEPELEFSGSSRAEL